MNQFRINRSLSSGQIEETVRKALPCGTPISNVERFLKQNRLIYGFDKFTSTIYTTIRRVRGSFIASKDVEIRCHFTADRKLDKLTFVVSNSFL